MNSEQLELDLFPGEPWDGKSPRALTRGRLLFILKPGGAKSMRDEVDPLQYDMWPTATNAPRFVYRGAPLLRRFSYEEDSRT